MTIDKQINDAKSRVGDAERKLNEAKAALFQLQCDKAGVHIGDRVRYRCGDKVEIIVGKIEDFTTHDLIGTRNPWVSGRVIKRDGTVGATTRNLLRDWEMVQPKETK